MSRPRRILDVAPRYRSGSDGATTGHYTVYHDDLRASAMRSGLPFAILTDRSQPAADGVMPLLNTSSRDAVVASLADIVQDDDLVMVYEGSVRYAELLCGLAARTPRVRYVVNLFQQARLVVDRRRWNPRTRRPPVYRWEQEIPGNLFISAETPRRAELAEAVGLRTDGIWRLHTRLWATPASEIDAAGAGPRALRVLIPVTDRGLDAQIVHDVAAVVERNRLTNGENDIRWTITGAGSSRPAAQVWLQRLSELGVTLVSSPPHLDDYRTLFLQHDVIWIPHSEMYRSQSSGKTLDGLALGRPVVARRGTWPTEECRRWTGADLAYDGPGEAACVFGGLTRSVDAHGARLRAAGDTIREAHAPEATLGRVLEIAGLGDPLPGLPEIPALSSSPAPRCSRWWPGVRSELAARRAVLSWPVTRSLGRVRGVVHRLGLSRTTR